MNKLIALLFVIISLTTAHAQIRKAKHIILIGCDGPGVRKDHEIKDVIITYDTAATITWILGLKDPQAWRGKPVLSAFN